MTAVSTILVTRAQPGASETAARLCDLGFMPLVSPALTLEAVTPPPPLDLSDLQGVVFTSANGVRALVERTPPPVPTAWCVGPATCAEARASGFANTISADGNADDLAALIMAKADPAAGALLHIANAAAGRVLVSALAAAGFDARFAGLYAPHAASRFAGLAKRALESGNVSAVLFHSARGARAFAALAAPFDLSQTVAVGVSEKALAPAARLGWLASAAAEKPNEDALLAALRHTMPPV